MCSEREGNCGGTAVRSGIERRELWRECSAQWDREKGTVEGVQCAVREKGTVEGLQCAVG